MNNVFIFAIVSAAIFGENLALSKIALEGAMAIFGKFFQCAS